jgi:hypothetical protein
MRCRLLAISFLLSLLPACTVVTSPLQIEPARKATPVSPKFGQSYYYVDRDQNLYFVMRSTATEAGKPVDQVMTIRVFWQPRGGVTTMNPAALNATFRYVVMTPDAMGLYEGAGFVRLDSKLGAATFKARVVDGDMRLSQATLGFVDTLGRARLTGAFTAAYDDAQAMDLRLDSQREFFVRSLKGPATQTQPAASAPATRG